MVPFCIAAAFWWLHPDLTIDADSARYLSNSPMRTATYPLFLDIAYGAALLPLQLFLFAGALSWLAIYCSKFLPWIANAAIVLAIGANPYVWELQASVMTEALTIPILTIIVGCILGFSESNRPFPIIAAAVLGGIATTIRPQLLPLIMAPLCAAWIAQDLSRRVRLLLIIIITWSAPVILERAYSHAAHGNQLTSPLGRTLFIKAAVIDAPITKPTSQDDLDRQLAHFLNNEYAPARRIIGSTKDRDVRYILLTNYESCAWLACISRVMQGSRMGEAEIHRHMMRVAIARLASNPMGFLELAATEYHRIWLLHPRKHPDLALKYNAFLEREAPIPFQSLLSVEGQPTPAREQNPIFRVNRMAFEAIGLLAAVMTFGFAIWHPNSSTRAAFAIVLGFQATLALSALAGVGFPRYAMGMWPALIACEVLGIFGLLRWRARSPSSRTERNLSAGSGSVAE